jgi:pimeloyl-ACP methyl ester carboxylesterase
LRLHYLDWGGAGRQPMLLLHGLQDCARCWDFFAAAMRHRYHVLALDHRGHGDSPWPSPPAYRLEEYVGELAEVIEALDLRDLLLIGHSAGGKNAFVYAADRPQRLSRLVIVDMDPDAHNPGSAQMLARYRGESDQYPSLEAVVERLRSREPHAPEEALRHHARHLTKPLPQGGLAWKRDRKVVALYHRPDAWEHLPRISVPTLLVRGAESTLLTAPVAERMRRAIPRCTLVELAGGGHWCYDEQPDAFQRAVAAFLA